MKRFKYLAILAALLGLFPATVWGTVAVKYYGSLDCGLVETAAQLEGKTKLKLATDFLFVGGTTRGIVGYRINNQQRSFTESIPGEFVPIFIQIKSKVSLLNGLEPAVLTIGDLSLNYSPYALCLDGTEGNGMKKGISIEWLPLGRAQFSSFLAWDPQLYSRYQLGGGSVQVGLKTDNLAYGVIGDWAREDQRFQAMAVGYVDQYRTSISEITYGSPNVEQLVTLANWRKDTGKLQLSFLAAQATDIMRKRDSSGQVEQEQLTRAPLQLYELKYQLTPFLFAKAYWRDFDPGFSPLYADKTPLFYDNRYYGGNQLALFGGQRGFGAEVGYGYKGINLLASFHKWNERREEAIPEKSKLWLSLDLPVGRGTFGAKHRTETTAYTFANLSQQQLLQKSKELTRFKYGQNLKLVSLPARGSVYLQQEGQGDGAELLFGGAELATSVEKGILSGMKIKASLDYCLKGSFQNSRWRRLLGVSYQTARGFYLRLTRVTPSTDQQLPLEQRWDQDLQELSPINEFEIGINVLF